MTRWLITGGAGYIGAHVADAMLASGRDVTVLDDLSTGRPEFTPEGARTVVGSILDRGALADALADADGVVHLAGYKYAGESVRRPLHTWRQNVSGTIDRRARSLAIHCTMKRIENISCARKPTPSQAFSVAGVDIHHWPSMVTRLWR